MRRFFRITADYILRLNTILSEKIALPAIEVTIEIIGTLIVARKRIAENYVFDEIQGIYVSRAEYENVPDLTAMITSPPRRRSDVFQAVRLSQPNLIAISTTDLFRQPEKNHLFQSLIRV